MKTPRRIQRFDVRAELGQGAGGTVYRAHDPQLDREVAIKVMRGTRQTAHDDLSTIRTVDLREDAAAGSGDALHEARMMARLSHPNIVPIYEVGLDDDAVFVVMEHVAGQDLRSWLRTPRRPREIVAAFVQAGAGLAAAHARGIVHRDFKPDNVLVGADGRVRVADFGLSRITKRSSMSRTDDRAGTPRYMAPELWDGREASPSSDVYAFAIALLEALDIELEERDPEPLFAKLRATGLRPPACRAVIAATASDPAARPTAAVLVASLALSPRPHAFALAIGAAAVAATTAVAIIALTRTNSVEYACDPPAGFGRWADERDAVRAALSGHGRAALIVQQLDDHDAALRSADAAACTAAREGKLTHAQVGAWRHCLERRGLEIEAVVQRLLRTRDAQATQLRLAVAQHPESCATILHGAVAQASELAPLYTRLVDSPGGPLEDVLRDRSELASRARRLGDRELEARVLVSVAAAAYGLDRVDDALRAVDQMRSIALELQHHDLHALALAWQSLYLTDASRIPEAAAASDQAVGLIERPMRAFTRMYVHKAAGWSAFNRNDLVRAASHLEAALAIAQAAELPEELKLRELSIEVKVQQRAGPDVLLAALDEMRRRTGVYVADPDAIPELHDRYARIWERSGRDDLAVVYQELALRAAKAAGVSGSDLWTRRLVLASAREGVDGDRQALAELTALVNELDPANPATRRHAPRAYIELAMREITLVDVERGLARFRRGLEELIAQRGRDDDDVLVYRFLLAMRLVELGNVAAATAEGDTLLEAYARAARPDDHRPAEVRGLLFATIALVTGDFETAERLAREHGTEMQAHGSTSALVRHAELLHGEALVELGRADEARSRLSALLLRLSALGGDAEDLAPVELQLARAELALGERRLGRERLLRAARVLREMRVNSRWSRQAAKLAKAHR